MFCTVLAHNNHKIGERGRLGDAVRAPLWYGWLQLVLQPIAPVYRQQFDGGPVPLVSGFLTM
jgi:hypothetical protein